MLSKNQVKYIHSLRLGKFRDEYRVFTVEGVKMVDELVRSSFETRQIYATPSWLESRKYELQKKDIDIGEVSEDDLRKISNLVTPNEVLAVAAYPDRTMPASEHLGKIVLALDCIQDPGNLGTIIRTADWFGIRNVVCSPGTADIFNPKVVQSTMGSIFRVDVFYTGLNEFFAGLGSQWNIYGTDAGGEDIFGIKPDFPAVLVIGNESKGISEELLPLLTRKIGIPGGSSGAESLNASVAAGIVMAQVCGKI